MNLSHVKLDKQDDEAFHLRDKSGPFKVYKKAVSKQLLDAIHQHFAQGGEVKEEKKRQDWEMAPNLDLGVPDSQAAQLEADQSRIPPSMRYRPTTESQVKERKAQDEAKALERADTAYQAANSPMNLPPGANPASDAFSPVGLLKYYQGQQSLTSPAPAAPEENMSPVAGYSPMPPGAPAPPPAPGAPPAPAQTGTGGSGMAGGSGGGGYEAQLAKAGDMAARAEMEKGQLAQQKANEMLPIQQRLEQQKVATAKLWDDRYNEAQARGEQLAKDLAQEKLDPRRFWHNKNVGQKVAATLALALGGFGQAFGGGPNPALAMLQKQAEEDVEAQKADLGKKQSILSHYVQQGHDIQEAKKLAIADLMDGARGQMELMATKYGGKEAAVAAKQNIATIAKDTALQRQEAHGRGLQQSLAGLQIQAQKEALGQAHLERAAMSQFLGGGQQMDPRAIPLLPKEIQEKLVTLPDGTYATARSPKDAEEVRKSQEATALLRNKLQRYRAILENHPSGISETLSPEDYKAAEGLHASILTDLNGLAGLNRFTHEEAQIFSERIPDIRKLGRKSGKAAQMEELGKEIDDKVSSTNRTFLNLPTPKRRTDVVRD